MGVRLTLEFPDEIILDRTYMTFFFSLLFSCFFFMFCLHFYIPALLQGQIMEIGSLRVWLVGRRCRVARLNCIKICFYTS